MSTNMPGNERNEVAISFRTCGIRSSPSLGIEPITYLVREEAWMTHHVVVEDESVAESGKEEIEHVDP